MPPEPTLHWHTEPEQAALDRRRLEDGLNALEAGRQAGRHPGAQVYVGRFGRPVLEYACGEARPGVAMTPEHVTPWFSSGKPLVAMAVALLYDRRLLDPDDRVVRYIPRFRAGKEACTIRHVLTHTGGFAGAVTHRDAGGWDEVIERICAYPAEYPPGTKAGYHSTGGWYILGEIIRVVDGRPVTEFLGDELLAPLGLEDTHLGIPAAQQERLGDRLAHVALGRTEREHFASQAFVEQWNGAAEMAHVNPGGGMRGPARELGRFYDMLLAGGAWQGAERIDRRSVALFTACHRWDLPDRTLQGAPLPWGLGFGLYGNADMPRNASRRTFGHSGMVSTVAWADPQRQVSCVILTTGLLDPLTNARRLREVGTAVVKACAPADGA